MNKRIMYNTYVNHRMNRINDPKHKLVDADLFRYYYFNFFFSSHFFGGKTRFDLMTCQP